MSKLTKETLNMRLHRPLAALHVARRCSLTPGIPPSALRASTAVRDRSRRFCIRPETRNSRAARLGPGCARTLRLRIRELIFPLLLAAAPTQACDGLRVDGGWVRLPPPNAVTAAAYVTLTNRAAHPVTIVAISSPDFGHTMLHETRYVDGRAEMRHLGDLTLASGETFIAAPGAVHVMLGAPLEPLELERYVDLVLECRQGDPLRFTLPIKQKAP